MSNAPTLTERLEQAGNSTAQSWIITELLLNAYPATIRQSVIAAAVPHWFTAEILAALLDLSMVEAEERYVALQQLSIVQPFGDLGYTLHDLTRSGILAYLASNAPEELRKYSQHVHTYLSNQNSTQDSQTEVESIYHQLIFNIGEGRSTLKTYARTYRNKDNFAAIENLLRNYRELIALDLLESTDQVELERQEYWAAEALANRGKKEADEQGTQYLRKALEQFAPPEQLPELLANEPEKWREQVDTYKHDFVLNRLEAARKIGDLPQQLHWLVELSAIYRSKGNLEDAIQYLDSALMLSSEDTRTWASRGLTMRMMKRYKEAIADFDSAISLDQTYTWAIAQRGITYQLLRSYEEALADLDHAIALDNTRAWIIAQRGMTYRIMARYTEALADLDRAIVLDEKFAWAIAQRGITYALLDRYTEALADLDRAIALDEKLAWVIAQRGMTYRIMARYTEALADLDRAIVLDEKFAWIIAQRGLTYYLMKSYTESLAEFNRAIELDDNLAWVIGNRGYVYLLLKCYGEAQVDLNKSLSITEGEWQFYSRGLLYTVQNQTALAHADIRRAIELAQVNHATNPNNWRNTLNLMLYHLVAGENKVAEKFLQEAFEGKAPILRLKAAIQDLEELLIVLPNHPQARIFLQHIEAHVADLG